MVKERSEDGALRQASQLALTEIRRDREPRDREGADLGSSYLCMPLALFLLVYVRIQMFKDDTFYARDSQGPPQSRQASSFMGNISRII